MTWYITTWESSHPTHAVRILAFTAHSPAHVQLCPRVERWWTWYITTWESSHPTHVVQQSTHSPSLMGPGCSNDRKGRELCSVAKDTSQRTRGTQCSTPKWWSVLYDIFIHDTWACFTSLVQLRPTLIRDDLVYNHIRVLTPHACGRHFVVPHHCTFVHARVDTWWLNI